ncbi:uncharacterized protein LOC121738509 [Aricia agestis]|uniref:uncharacterized protein LOC121738509 n=1 Tax=Aricia agestis TaxID=91739 RepID=UPI001C202254|nr:uncharacterized protein LOC121738509 [Aricia agestis]
MNRNNHRVPEQFVLAAILSGGLTILTSLAYITLCTVALIFRFDCSAGQLSNTDGSQYFLTTIYRVYIQSADCENALRYGGITQSHSVFILITIILSFSVLSLCSSIAIIAVANSETGSSTINIYSCVHIGVYVAMLVVDLTLAIHFGMDHTLLQSELAMSTPGLGMNYEKDMIRLGLLLLMTISLKGYIIHAINIVLLIVLAVYAVRHQRRNDNVHSIHNLGVLNAFERPKRVEDPWQQNNEMFYARGPHSNNAYSHDEDFNRNPIRESLHMSNNRPHDRSNSWHRSEPAPVGSRPFSYLEEPKRPVPVKPPTTPTKDPNWRRDPWPPAPYVPDPDYSPPQSRRLKSALKTGY